MSADAISSPTFGGWTARRAVRGLVDLETIVGLATFTLALGRVVTAFGLLGALETLHDRLRSSFGGPDPIYPALERVRVRDTPRRSIAATHADPPTKHSRR